MFFKCIYFGFQYICISRFQRSLNSMKKCLTYLITFTIPGNCRYMDISVVVYKNR